MYALPVVMMLIVLVSACATNTGNDDARAAKKSPGAATADTHVAAAGTAVAAQPAQKPTPAAKAAPAPTQPKKVAPSKAMPLAKASKPLKRQRKNKATPAVSSEEVAANTEEPATPPADDAAVADAAVAEAKPPRLQDSTSAKAQIPPSSQVRKELRQLQAQRAAARRMAQVQAGVDKKKADRVERFVAAETLNIRATPSEAAPVVGKLVRGSMMPVEITGAWAKIGEGQWVMTKYLSASRPSARRVAYGK